MNSIQGVFITYQFIGPNRYRYSALALFAAKNIYKDSTPTNAYERKCDLLATKLLVHAVVAVIVDLISYGLVIVGPAYVFITEGRFVMPTGVIVPFMDPDSRLGFVINLSIQFLSAFTALIGTMGLQITNCLIVNSFTTMTDLVCLNMKTFSDGLRARHFTYQQKKELRNIIVQLQDLEGYISELNDLLYWRTFTLPILTTFGVSLAIFSQMIVRSSFSLSLPFISYLKIVSVRFVSSCRMDFQQDMGLH